MAARIATMLAILAAGSAAGTSCIERNCVADRDCDDGEVCPVPNYLVTRCEATCVPAPVRGETCINTSDGVSCADFVKTCAAGLVCAQTSGDGGNFGACAPPSDRVEGEFCDVDDQCADGLVCALFGRNDSGGMCAPLVNRAASSPCNDDAQCASDDCSDQLLCR